MVMRYTVPRGLMAVGNGRLLSREIKGEKETFVWKVRNPINNYNVTLNVADYVLISDQYVQEDGETLDLSYYVLRANEAQARKHFEQVKPMLACFEERMGKYPFYEDGYALVETPTGAWNIKVPLPMEIGIETTNGDSILSSFMKVVMNGTETA